MPFAKLYEITNELETRLLSGEKFTKSQINALIPKDMDCSCDDALRYLRDKAVIKPECVRAKEDIPTYWYFPISARQMLAMEPDKYHLMRQREKQSISLERDTSMLKGIIKRRGTKFIKAIISSLL